MRSHPDVAADAPVAFVLCRELDYFEQLAALERWVRSTSR